MFDVGVRETMRGPMFYVFFAFFPKSKNMTFFVFELLHTFSRTLATIASPILNCNTMLMTLVTIVVEAM